MRILIITDSFKENLTSREVCSAIHKGITSILPNANINEIPFSDGGEGSLNVLADNFKGEFVICKTEDALG